MTYTKKEVTDNLRKTAVVAFMFGALAYTLQVTKVITDPLGLVGSDKADIHGKDLHGNALANSGIMNAVILGLEVTRMGLTALGEAAAPKVQSCWQRAKTSIKNAGYFKGTPHTLDETKPLKNNPDATASVTPVPVSTVGAPGASSSV